MKSTQEIPLNTSQILLNGGDDCALAIVREVVYLQSRKGHDWCKKHQKYADSHEYFDFVRDCDFQDIQDTWIYMPFNAYIYRIALKSITDYETPDETYASLAGATRNQLMTILRLWIMRERFHRSNIKHPRYPNNGQSDVGLQQPSCLEAALELIMLL